MALSRWLLALGCLCLLAMPALAQSTVQDFSNPGVKGTNYAEYGTGTGSVQSGGPAGATNYYRLTQTGVGSTNNIIAFDLTSPGKSSHVVGSFDFRIGGTLGCHADGIGLVLIDTSNFGTTGNGPSIAEEGSTNRGGGLGIGLDDYNNGNPYDTTSIGLPNATDGDEVSVNLLRACCKINYFRVCLACYQLVVEGDHDRRSSSWLNRFCLIASGNAWSL
jgi:hypothetical protein